MNLKNQLQITLRNTIIRLWPELKEQISSGKLLVEVERPQEEKFGDYSTNLAMKLAAILKSNPMQIAHEITAFLENQKISKFKKILYIAPGFINFYLSKKWLAKQISQILQEKKKFGASKSGKNKKVQVEFISANPTGPLTLGNGRGGFLGDVLANILKLAGYRVQREFYINDAGNQIEILAESILRRYWQINGIVIDYPDYCYKGKYVEDLARQLFLPNYKLSSKEKLDVVKDKIKYRILEKVIGSIRKIVSNKLKIKFDKWFYERSLYQTKQVDKILDLLKAKNFVYEKDGATWLKTKDFGDEKDRVLIKENGEPVYFLSDIAYHYNKFKIRKFDKVIDIWGADHHGYVGRMQAVARILDFFGKLDIIIVQFVRLIQNDQEIKMSKRLGTFVTLEELVDEVGLDAARFFFLMYDVNTHMDFNLDLAKKKSKDNPVYYVQYAHARICSIIKKVKELKKGSKGLKKAKGRKDEKEDNRVNIKVEYDLIRELIKWPELVEDAALTYQVHKLPFYAVSLATKFHDFYTQCRVIDKEIINEARMDLVKATQIVLQNVLACMGVSAPEKM